MLAACGVDPVALKTWRSPGTNLSNRASIRAVSSTDRYCVIPTSELKEQRLQL